MTDLAPRYLRWLGDQLIPPEGKKEYNELLGLLQSKEFVWFVPNDDNRLEDGLELRREYFHDPNPFPEFGCTTLELIVGLSRRLAFQVGGTEQKRAWELIKNLELHKMSDPLTRKDISQVDEVLECVIWRNYQWDGCGGFFPLAWAQEDQRQVEIWYQMMAYIREMHQE